MTRDGWKLTDSFSNGAPMEYSNGSRLRVTKAYGRVKPWRVVNERGSYAKGKRARVRAFATPEAAAAFAEAQLSAEGQS